MGELIKQRHDALSAMRGAVADREVVPFYQPIVRASDFTLAAFEALVRWVRPNGHVVPPAFFMAALADPAMSCMIGEIMIAGVASQLAQWRQEGLEMMPVSVNVSPDQVARPDFAPALLNVCAVHGIPQGGLNVEITEHVLLSRDRQRTMRAFETLAQAGIKIALDDFGTGYASLTHLKEYPVDRIKIDRSFISQLPGDTGGLGIVKAVISLAHDLGKEVVAEGVENTEQAQLLAHLGCDFLQGFLFAKPLPPEQAGEFIRTHSGARPAVPHKAEVVQLHAAGRR
jgi:EAL domain-containing protein (putative c-di-GMP-specific phosphodiesterase class I)